MTSQVSIAAVLTSPRRELTHLLLGKLVHSDWPNLSAAISGVTPWLATGTGKRGSYGNRIVLGAFSIPDGFIGISSLRLPAASTPECT